MQSGYLLKTFSLLLAICGLSSQVSLHAQTNTFPTSGNVGIGTTSPSFSLHAVTATTTSTVAAFDGKQYQTANLVSFRNWYGLDAIGIVPVGSLSADLGINFRTSGNGSSTYMLTNMGAIIQQPGGTFFVRAASAQTGNILNVQDATGAATYLAVNAGGNVGIGTTNPTQKLSVNGTIRAKEVIVDTGWSDYIFAPDYKLASLSEVETHIKENGHLPGIPSAKEVAEHGVSIGEMQSKLLAKIEELTLHVIDQEKHQHDQEDRIERLEAENKALRMR